MRSTSSALSAFPTVFHHLHRQWLLHPVGNESIYQLKIHKLQSIIILNCNCRSIRFSSVRASATTAATEFPSAASSAHNTATPVRREPQVDGADDAEVLAHRSAKESRATSAAAAAVHDEQQEEQEDGQAVLEGGEGRPDHPVEARQEQDDLGRAVAHTRRYPETRASLRESSQGSHHQGELFVITRE